MTNYIEVAEFKDRYGITSSNQDVTFGEHITAACRKIDAITFRTFGADAVATARYFRPLDCETVYINDAYDIDSVEVDGASDGTYSTTWSATDYETDPENGIGPNGEAGFPVTTIRAVGSVYFPAWSQRRRVVKVTAKWGWAAVPDAVREAAYMLANRLSYEKGVPGGVTAPNVDFGLPGSALQRPYTAEGLLRPYVRPDRAIGVA